MFSIFFGLAAAFSWGAGDFAGGFVSRRAGAVRAGLYVQSVGLLPLLVLAFANRQLSNMPVTDWLLCGAAGVIGSLGMLALYRALEQGQMSVAAPVAALTAAILPILAGGMRDGWTAPHTLLGFGLALVATWLISQTGSIKHPAAIKLNGLGLPALAGVGTGAYFILMNQGSQASVLAPQLAVRAAGMATITIFAAFTHALQLPSRSIWPMVIVNTCFDIGGGIFYVLAGQSGRMDIAALLSSLYSGVTVLLAWFILRENLTQRQWLGVLITLIAIMLITR